MDFEFTKDQKMLQEEVRKFADAHIAPDAAEIDQSRDFPWKNIKKTAEMGLLGIIVPEKYGGSGFDYISLAIAIEELSRCCASTGVIVAVNNSLVTYPIVAFGTEEQKQKYLPALCSGEKLGAFGLTEPNAGSDVAGMETTARLEGDHYIINGTKRFITNAGEAGTFIVFASTDRNLKHKGISTFIVERDTPGFSLGKHEDLMGVRATANCELIFEDAKIPKENLLGKEGQGFMIAMNVLDVSRIDIGAQAVGIAQSALDESVKYAKERKAFGQPIGNFEMIQNMLAEMATQICAARFLVYYAGHCKNKGMPRFSRESAMSKYYGATIAVDVARKGVQIHGGYGYTKDYPIERIYRDAKILELYEGTSEIQKIVIARDLLK
ncbi:MAG: acyl-CoA dehydrogenase [candidate division WOR-3 bacterium]|nr:MAG: acyl-CoA dehydrogenase [candidate division WOR-3 bacterium]